MGRLLLRALLLAALISVSLGAKKYPIAVPSWAPLPFPFSTGMVTCLAGASDCLLHVSGMQGFDMTASPPVLVAGGIANQTMQTLKNIEAVTKEAGGSLDNIVECTVMLANASDFPAMNTVYSTFFGAVKPTRAAAAMGVLGDGLVEIKCSGWAPTPAVEVAH